MTSYWQKGCDDAKAGLLTSYPKRGGGLVRENRGYLNGYRYGRDAATTAPPAKVVPQPEREGE